MNRRLLITAIAILLCASCTSPDGPSTVVHSKDVNEDKLDELNLDPNQGQSSEVKRNPDRDLKTAMMLPSFYQMPPAIPKENQPTQERASLGKKLFFDTILSDDGSVACASCHDPDHGFASSDPLAIGFDGIVGDRNAPSLINSAFGKTFFWDGRAESLEAQSLQPIENEKEFNSSIEAVLERLRSSERYVNEFRIAFIDKDEEDDSGQEFITKENLAKALAAFQRTLIAEESPVDRFQSGKYDSLSKEARQGLWIFESRGNCWKCHSGDNFSDDDFHNTGVAFRQQIRDTGRYQVTGNEADKHKFKTPGLRGVTKTAPYMHDGSIETLREVVDFYNRGGNQDAPNLSAKIKPLGLSEQEVDALVAFLKALSDGS